MNLKLSALVMPVAVALSVASCSSENKKNEAVKGSEVAASSKGKIKPHFYGDEKTLGIPVTIAPFSVQEFEELESRDGKLIADLCNSELDEECYKKIENYFLTKDSQTVKRSDDVLVFRLENGDSLSLKDVNEDDPETYIRYSYEGQLDTCGYYLVDVSHYEETSHLIIDRKNGETVNLWSKPYNSGDCRLAVVSSYDMEAGFNMNGLQLLNLENDKIKLEWEKEISDWGPAEIRWIDNRKVAMKQIVPDHENGGEIVNYAIMEIAH